MSARIFLNGEWLTEDRARVSVMDRGFLFGDGVYEVIPVYSRQAFRLEQHLARLQKSLDGIQLANPYRLAEWIAFITQLASEAEWEDQSIYIQVTRGPMAVRNHAFPTQVTPTTVILAEAIHTPPASQREQGIAAVSAQKGVGPRAAPKRIRLGPAIKAVVARVAIKPVNPAKPQKRVVPRPGRQRIVLCKNIRFRLALSFGCRQL